MSNQKSTEQVKLLELYKEWANRLLMEKAQLVKLLELYKELIKVKDEWISIAWVDDKYYGQSKKEVDLEKQIKELENER